MSLYEVHWVGKYEGSLYSVLGDTTSYRVIVQDDDGTNWIVWEDGNPNERDIRDIVTDAQERAQRGEAFRVSV